MTVPSLSFPSILEPDQKRSAWLSQAQALIGFSQTKRRVQSSAIIALSSDASRILGFAVDGFPEGVNHSSPRQQDTDCWNGMHLDAEFALVAQAAKHAFSLTGATVYCWPMLSTASAAALLIAAGVREIVEPDYPVPLSRELDRRLIRTMAAEAGVCLVKSPMDVTLGAQNETPSEHSHFSEFTHASAG